MAGCETTQNIAEKIPKQTKTRILFDTSDLLYSVGIGDAGVQGFCKRIQSYLTNGLADIGVTAVAGPDTGTSEATIKITLSALEQVGATDFIFFGTQRIRVKYSAILSSPAGVTVATWKHEDDEDSLDKLSGHMASDIVKYLKKGFR